MYKSGWAANLSILVLSLCIAPLLVACGSTGQSGSGPAGNGTSVASAPQHLAVADNEDNRVLIFNAPFTTDESASVVLGQPDFTQQQANQGGAPAGNTLSSPSGLAIDAAGNLYVADMENCRLLQFRPPFTTNMNASLILGNAPQGDSPCGTGPASMDQPGTLAMDAHGDLWVVQGNRVAEYTPPFSHGMSASVVLGQSSASGDACNAGAAASNGSNPSAATLCNPVGAAFDSQGDLWVADGLNARVLEYAPPFSTGMAATMELGVTGPQTFTSAGCVNGQAVSSKLCYPQALAFDSSGNLWVTTAFSGVYEFAPPFSNGMPSETVFGQPPSGNHPPAANTTEIPYGIFQSGDGNLLISDTGDNRVLIFAPPFGAGMRATTVIGQANMTTGTDSSGATANKLWYPVGALTF